MTAPLAWGIDPSPPWGTAGLPWDEPISDPVAEIAAERSRLGDTFALRSGEQTYLFVFSLSGVRSFYNLSESDASKSIADWRMLRRKVPDELFVGRRTLPTGVFGRQATAAYLANVDAALDAQAEELGNEGTVDVFDLTRRLGHRVGLSSWGPPGVLAYRFEELIGALDQLDGAAAFVTPAAMLKTAETDRADERAALERAAEILGALINRHEDSGLHGETNAIYQSIADRWLDEPDDARPFGIANDVILLHIGSMSNLFAALGWALIDLIARPDLYGRTHDDDVTLEQCSLESIRLAQRSIMLREVLRPVDLTVDGTSYRLERGVTVATLLPLTNSSAPGYERFDPNRWKGRRLDSLGELEGRELVTTFGHGEHTCPAQPFSLAAMTRTLRFLLDTFHVEPLFDRPRPLMGQIGGVARANEACLVAYRRRESPPG